jgi:hypothetical protein
MQEKIGNIMATILTGIILISILFNLFILVFRDGRGMGMYGNRGNALFYDNER